MFTQPFCLRTLKSHPSRVLDDLDVLLAELVRVELEEPLGNLRERRELRLFVDVFLAVLVLEEALWWERESEGGGVRAGTSTSGDG